MADDATPRPAAILSAALTAFSRYGYSRTKMDDIAQASGVPRTAIYKTFRNKSHIFRSLAEGVHHEAIAAAEAALAREAPFRDRLENALIARDVHLLAIGHTGPHADEIAELYVSLAGDLAETFNAAWVEKLAGAAEAAIEAGDFTLPAAYASAEDFARLLRLALEGVKKEVKSPAEFERLARQLISAMAR